MEGGVWGRREGEGDGVGGWRVELWGGKGRVGKIEGGWGDVGRWRDMEVGQMEGRRSQRHWSLLCPPVSKGGA